MGERIMGNLNRVRGDCPGLAWDVLDGGQAALYADWKHVMGALGFTLGEIAVLKDILFARACRYGVDWDGLERFWRVEYDERAIRCFLRENFTGPVNDPLKSLDKYQYDGELDYWPIFEDETLLVRLY